jgi:hypothetical protein
MIERTARRTPPLPDHSVHLQPAPGLHRRLIVNVAPRFRRRAEGSTAPPRLPPPGARLFAQMPDQSSISLNCTATPSNVRRMDWGSKPANHPAASNSPPDRDCTDSQIKKTKQPQRRQVMVGDRLQISKRTQFIRVTDGQLEQSKQINL